jgi:uncharacterized protein YndB with AHSA1/START domain
MHGTYETVDQRPVLRFERSLAHPVDAVWAALTDPAELAHWFPSTVTLDPRVGGAMSFTFHDGLTLQGEVTELDPPRLFAFWWGDDLLRFELESSQAGCLLRFTVELDATEKAARDAAGWHVCLDRLEARLSGQNVTAPDSTPTREWRGHYEDYASRGLPTGAPIPE